MAVGKFSLSKVLFCGFLLLSCLVFWSFGLFSFSFVGEGFSYYNNSLFFEGCWGSLSLVCFLMLLCCGLIALFYCFHYFEGGEEAGSLFPIMVWFLGVMGFLVFSSSLIVSLIFWEYLGLVSFFLILFYSNGASVRASLITLYMSRFGDVALFLLVMWFSYWGFNMVWFCSLLLLLVVLTKSACYPFISWLLEAMRAPTPVSSLVHSSTLVAAGVWFFLCYSYIFGEDVKGIIFFLSLLTIFISGLCASGFNDLKKVVALSTCNNVSWCLIFFICGDLGLALLQLLTHGVCKCYLFMSVGDLMSQSGSSQSAVGVYLGQYSGFFGVMGQGVLIFSLCGLPYLGVFFTKHGLFNSVFYSFGWGSLICLLLGVGVSCVYSVRFMLLLCSSRGGLSVGYSSSFMIVSLLCFMGTLVNFFGSSEVNELYTMSFFASGSLLLFQVLGVIFGCFLFYSGEISSLGWSSLLWGSDGVVNYFYRFFLPLGEVSYLVTYRWEFYFFGLMSRASLWGGVSPFSLNFMILCLLFLSVLYSLLF